MIKIESYTKDDFGYIQWIYTNMPYKEFKKYCETNECEISTAHKSEGVYQILAKDLIKEELS
jgi:hypothetical protein